MPSSAGCELEPSDSGRFCDEFESLRRRVRQGIGLLDREPKAFADRLGGTEVYEEGENPHLAAAKRAQKRVDAATQIAMGVEEALFIHLDEALEVMGQSAVEDRVPGTTWAIDLRARSCRDCLHHDGEDETGGRDLAVEPKRQDSEGPRSRPYQANWQSFKGSRELAGNDISSAPNDRNTGGEEVLRSEAGTRRSADQKAG